MQALKTQINPQSPEFRANAETMRALVEDLRAKVTDVAQGGGETARARHTARGKLLPRDRVSQLLDPGTPFLEIGQLAAFGMYDGDAPAAGVIAGIGCVQGVQCMVVANDATVKGGTYYPMTVKKHLRAQEIAEQNHLPCIYLVDSGGAFLPKQDEVFPDRDHFGRIFFNQANMSAKGIPQVAMVMGSCTAGGAYVPAMSDETVIVRNQGTIFLGGPPLVKAATGEEVSAEDLGGGDVHTRISGVADQLAENDAHAIHMARRIVANLNRMPQVRVAMEPSEEPLYDPAETLRHHPAGHPQTLRRARDHRPPRRRLALRRVQAALRHDAGDRVRAPLRHAGRNRRQQRHPVLGVGPEGRAFHRVVRAARRAPPVPAEHPGLHGRAEVRERRDREGRRQDGDRGCDRPGPEGHHADRRQLRGRQLRHVRPGLFAALSLDVAQCAHQRHGRRAGGWRAGDRPARRHGPKGGEWSAEEEEKFKAPIRSQYETQGHPYYATARMWDDGVVDPAQARRVLGLSFAAALNAPIPATKFGVFRM